MNSIILRDDENNRAYKAYVEGLVCVSWIMKQIKSVFITSLSIA